MSWHLQAVVEGKSGLSCKSGRSRKRDRKAATFVTVGEQDFVALYQGDGMVVEILGRDIHDSIRDEVTPRSVADIAYWMVDHADDGSRFKVRQVFFFGGDHDELDTWKSGLSDLARTATRRKAEKTLKIEIDEGAFACSHGQRPPPDPLTHGSEDRRVVGRFGEECTQVLILH